jgi:hypothetical protein
VVVGETLQAPSSDLDDLDNLDIYMPYESIARELLRSQVFLDKEIGSGEFGEVFSGRVVLQRTDPNNKFKAEKTIPVAVKTLKSSEESSVLSFKQEIALVGQLSHPQIVSLVGFVTKTNPILMCLEMMEFGSLKGYLTSGPVFEQLSNRQLITFALDICAGMNYVGQMGVVHRDLAARNVLVNKELVCKVADFGLAVSLHEADHVMMPSDGNERIPIRWTAPEAIADGRWSVASDAWCVIVERLRVCSVVRTDLTLAMMVVFCRSFGVTLYEVRRKGKHGLFNWSSHLRVCVAVVAGADLDLWCHAVQGLAQPEGGAGGQGGLPPAARHALPHAGVCRDGGLLARSADGSPCLSHGVPAAGGGLGRVRARGHEQL